MPSVKEYKLIILNYLTYALSGRAKQSQVISVFLELGKDQERQKNDNFRIMKIPHIF